MSKRWWLPILLFIWACALLRFSTHAQTLPNATPLTAPVFQAMQSSGRPYSGAKLCTYAAGSSTPQATYTDSTAGTPNANPVVLNALGQAPVYVGSLLYKFVLRNGGDGTCTTGTIVWSEDNVGDPTLYFVNYVKTAGTSTLITYTYPATGGVSQTVSARLAQRLSVKDFGATGDGSTDDTVAIQAAITAAQALTPTPCVWFPVGVYATTTATSAPIFQISATTLCIKGDSPFTTFIKTTAATTIFNLGTFNSTVAPPWVGTANYAIFKDITIENTAQANVSNTGFRTTRGIQTNGSGHITLDNVQFSGLQYGFAAPYGSDFDRIHETWCASNDVCIYMGPSSQQFEIDATEGHTNGEVIVCDGCGQGSMHDNHLVDSKTADITFEREQPTRSPFNWNPASIAAYDAESEVAVQNNWFETGAGFGGITSWQEYQRILFQENISDTSYPRHVTVKNSLLVLGNTGLAAKDGSPHAFMILNSGKFINVDNVDVVGDRRDYEIYSVGGNRLNLTNLTVEDGYSTSIPIFGFSSGTYASNNFSYTPIFGNVGATGSIPTTCFRGSQFYYDTTVDNWLGCQGTAGVGSLGTFSYLLQNLGDSTTVNAFQTQIFGGTQASNVGKFSVQNGGSPVDHVNFGGYDSSLNQTIILNPAAGLSSGQADIGSIRAGFINLIPTTTSVTFSNLGTPSSGTIVYCTDCTNTHTDAHTAGNSCAGSGTGALAIRENSNWNCFLRDPEEYRYQARHGL